MPFFFSGLRPTEPTCTHASPTSSCALARFATHLLLGRTFCIPTCWDMPLPLPGIEQAGVWRQWENCSLWRAVSDHSWETITCSHRGRSWLPLVWKLHWLEICPTLSFFIQSSLLKNRPISNVNLTFISVTPSTTVSNSFVSAVWLGSSFPFCF